ncbi:MAG: hypothetical protein L6R39_000407 [Caloplaca ligustica]|nr:MAG: hypothetical protein L6R39_000407 [Caloplaca ligustica]
MATTTLSVHVQQPPNSLNKSRNDDISVFQQLKDFRSQIPKNKLLEWETPSGYPTFWNISKDWGMILAAAQLYTRYPSGITLVVAMLIMSWGQRGLSNLAHDSIHRNLVAKKTWNDIIADIFLAPAFLTTAKLQREAHSAHHHYLGTAADPDHGANNPTSLKHYRTGHASTSILSLFLYDLLDPTSWYQNAIGSFTSAPYFLTAWWTLVTLLTSLLEPSSSPVTSLFSFPIPRGITFPVLFHLTRITLSHTFYILRETIDHSGLQPTSILAFTRSSPCCNAFQKFLQPHDDNYHLLHHLLPRIPMTRLHEAHIWLVGNCGVYREAETSKFLKTS